MPVPLPRKMHETLNCRKILKRKIKFVQVLKEKRPEDEEIDKKLEDGLKNKDINEPFNQEAVQEVYKPTR